MLGKSSNKSKKHSFNIKNFKKKKISLSRPVLIVIAIVLLAVVFGGFFGYRYYQNWSEDREVVIGFINKNIKEYNLTTNPSKEVVKDLNELVEFQTSNKEDTADRISQIKEKIQGIETINNEIDTSVSKIEEGNTEETTDLGREIRNTLQVKKFTLESLSEFLEYQICLIDNAVKQSNNLEVFSQEIKNFSENTDVGFDERNTYIQNATTNIDDNLKLIDEIESCFEEGYEQYYSQDLQSIIQTDKNLYVSYSEALKELQNGLGSNDSPVVQSATSKLVELSKKDVKLFQSEEIKEAIKSPISTIKNQAAVLDKQEESLEEKLNTLKGDYFLQS